MKSSQITTALLVSSIGLLTLSHADARGRGGSRASIHRSANVNVHQNRNVNIHENNNINVNR